MYPFCTSNNSLSFSATGETAAYSSESNIVNGIVYLIHGVIGIPLSSFILWVFLQPGQRQYTCYKLMAVTTVLDILNLINACIFAGTFSLFGLTHCNFGLFVHYVATWQFSKSHLRCLVLLSQLCFSSVVHVFHGMSSRLPEPTFTIYQQKLGRLSLSRKTDILLDHAFNAYNPHEGYYLFRRSSGLPNSVQIYGNFIRTGWVTLSYIVLCVLIYLEKRKNDSGTGKMPRYQIKVTIQTLLIAVLSDLCICFYLSEAYFSFPDFLARIAGILGQLFWIYMHGNSVVMLQCHMKNGFSGNCNCLHRLEHFSKIGTQNSTGNQKEDDGCFSKNRFC
ncbi:hypothetical protein L596_021091 [Steinernema carpocapsae]|uniref:G-protein coupled receptors family 1 profile domain-containing protein n=1 Tax=Steinernema carpocapsae TaxID=34508 RepID=A0A4U5MVG6_STECR|nr:hypothetical protein L596_021091 [Steinernema carpocapsae]